MGTISLEQLECHVHTLQILQMLLPQSARSSTLASTAKLVRTLCLEFGAATTLEEAIQTLVGTRGEAFASTGAGAQSCTLISNFLVYFILEEAIPS